MPFSVAAGDCIMQPALTGVANAFVPLTPLTAFEILRSFAAQVLSLATGLESPTKLLKV